METIGELPEMCNRIPSKYDMGLIVVDVLIDPFRPSDESSFISFENLEPRVHNVTFLVIVFSAKEHKNHS